MHIVVGAGIIGLSTAWILRGRGHEVTVCDPDPANGASRAAAGMLAPAAEVVWGQTPLYPLMRTSNELWPDFASDLADASGHDLGHTLSETLVCAGDRADLTALRELTAAQNAAGFETALIPGSAARALEPSLAPGVCGAIELPGDHAIDPRRVCGALLSLLEDCLIAEEVTAVSAAAVPGTAVSAGRPAAVTLASGRTITADRIVIAAGAAASAIDGVPNLPLRRVYGDVIRLRAPEHLTPLVTRTIRGLVGGRPLYVVPRPDGEIVLGASSREDGRSGTLAGGIHRLLRDAERMVPGILECEITDITTRARPGSPDDVPMIGRLGAPDRPGGDVIVSTGFFRHGILLAPIGARLTADLVCGDDPTSWAPEGTLTSVDPFRFDTSTPASTDPFPTEQTPARTTA